MPYMNKFNPLISEISKQTHKMYENMAIINQIWLRKNAILQEWAMYGTFVPDYYTLYETITTFFCKISQQTLAMYGKYDHN